MKEFTYKNDPYCVIMCLLSNKTNIYDQYTIN